MKNEIIFFLTHKYNNQILDNIHRISQEKGERDLLLLSHDNSIPNSVNVQSRSFSTPDLKSLNFEMLDTNQIPGSVHLPLFFFYRKFPNYKYYWYIEYDVEFGGHWSFLFDTFKNSKADFISSYVQKYLKYQYWPWWSLDHPGQHISKTDRIRSFNPIYRISNRALSFLNKELQTGWKGHHEVLLATLLHQNKFKLLDFRNGSEFSNSDYTDLYTGSVYFPDERIKSPYLGTLRYRPAMKKAGKRNLIYHPIKMDTGLTTAELIQYRLALLGKKLMKIPGSILKSINR